MGSINPIIKILNERQGNYVSTYEVVSDFFPNSSSWQGPRLEASWIEPMARGKCFLPLEMGLNCQGILVRGGRLGVETERILQWMDLKKSIGATS